MSMKRITCDVPDCTYNNSGLCSCVDVNICGPDAHCKSSTCCTSYDKCNPKADKVVCDCSPCDCVDCDAQTCAYNENCKCVLDELHVAPDDGSRQECGCPENTCCASFDCH